MFTFRIFNISSANSKVGIHFSNFFIILHLHVFYLLCNSNKLVLYKLRYPRDETHKNKQEGNKREEVRRK
jgi:hypothetical protein